MLAISRNYETYEWAVRTILGGALNIMVLQVFVQLVEKSAIITPSEIAFSPSAVIQLIILLAIVFITPFFSSLWLTKKVEELQALKIVPPLYLAFFDSAYFIIFVFRIPSNVEPSTIILASMIFLVSLVLVANLEDKAVVAILGRSAERELIYFEELKVSADIDEVKAKLSTPEIRRNLLLRGRVEGNRDEGYTMCTPRGFDFITKILLLKDKNNENYTIVKVAFYEKGRYSIRTSAYFVEEAKKSSAYLIDVLNDRIPKTPAGIIVPLTNSSHDLFVDTIIDDLRGYYIQTQQYAFGDWLKIISIIGIFLITAYLFLSGSILYAGLTFVIDLLFIFAEVPDLLSRRRG